MESEQGITLGLKEEIEVESEEEITVGSEEEVTIFHYSFVSLARD